MHRLNIYPFYSYLYFFSVFHHCFSSLPIFIYIYPVNLVNCDTACIVTHLEGAFSENICKMKKCSVVAHSFTSICAAFLCRNIITADMSQNEAMHDDDLEKSGEALIEFIKSSKAESVLRGAREKLQEFFDHHIKTKKTTTELLNGITLLLMLTFSLLI